jgi:hypothetical protein
MTTVGNKVLYAEMPPHHSLPGHARWVLSTAGSRLEMGPPWTCVLGRTTRKQAFSFALLGADTQSRHVLCAKNVDTAIHSTVLV